MGEAFEGVLGAERVLRAEGESLDGVPVSARLQPASAEEVAACLAEAHAHGIAVVVRGSGSKLGLGNPPAAESIVLLDTGGLSTSLDVEADEGIATVAAGVSVDALQQAAAAEGKRSLLDPGLGTATVGGVIATDPVVAESSLGLRLRNDLLGLEVALPNGTLSKCGGQVVKNVTGFDLVRLYCGSLGTLGVITRATLRVRPLPEERRVLALDCASLDEAQVAASRLELEQVGPRGAMIVPSETGARLVWLLEGGAADVAARAERVAGDALRPEDWDRQRRLVAGTDIAADAVRVRVGARPSDTSELAHSITELAGASALDVTLPCVGIAFATLSSESALVALWERAAARHWLLVIESAPTELKARHDVFGPATETLPLMRALKQRFDPDGVLAPGRFCGGI